MSHVVYHRDRAEATARRAAGGSALSWPAYVNTSGSAAYDITAYKVYRSPSISFIQSQTALVASLAPGITRFVDGTTDNPYGGGLYYYMVAVRTRSGVVINGTPLPVELPATGQTEIFIPALASGTLSAAYPNTVAVAGDGSHQPRVEAGAIGGLGATRAVFGFGTLNGALPGGAVVGVLLVRQRPNPFEAASGAGHHLYGLAGAIPCAA